MHLNQSVEPSRQDVSRKSTVKNVQVTDALLNPFQEDPPIVKISPEKESLEEDLGSYHLRYKNNR